MGKDKQDVAGIPSRGEKEKIFCIEGSIKRSQWLWVPHRKIRGPCFSCYSPVTANCLYVTYWQWMNIEVWYVYDTVCEHSKVEMCQRLPVLKSNLSLSILISFCCWRYCWITQTWGRPPGERGSALTCMLYLNNILLEERNTPVTTLWPQIQIFGLFLSISVVVLLLKPLLWPLKKMKASLELIQYNLNILSFLSSGNPPSWLQFLFAWRLLIWLA